ncbi:unnamed protein product [Urochloa decumbens]|uniref:Myb/SANT-like DNA-binding domain-containing protein n=1 Tax=Urochloa decumbens TaxID=240449 RepID=A0ABC8WF05_9POAL
MEAQRSVPSVKARAAHWSVAETRALVEAWEPLHQRRRQAQGDPWVPPHRRRSSLDDLVDEDWRAVAVAVSNSSRGIHRTAEQCKTRMRYLKTRYALEVSKKTTSSWKFFGVLDPTFARAMPLKKPKVEEVAREVGETSGAAEEERGGRGEAAGSTSAGAGSSVAAVLMRVADLCERVMLKWIEVQEAEKAAKDHP